MVKRVGKMIAFEVRCIVISRLVSSARVKPDPGNGLRLAFGTRWPPLRPIAPPSPTPSIFVRTLLGSQWV